MEVTLSAPDLATLGPRWRTLEARSDPSFFQSWTWIGCQVAARFNRPVLLAARQGGEDLALALFNRRAGALWLHETGNAALDALFVERNGLLIAQDREAILPMLLRRLPGRLVMSGISANLARAARCGRVVVGAQSRPAPVLDLSTPSLSQASANTRAQVRRSMRRYEAIGPLAIARADDPLQAREWLAELIDLHAATWRARGEPGAFADARILAFHHELLDRGAPRQEVDLLRITAGDSVIGLLYNMRRAGRVLAYQSGLAYDPDQPQLKPGLTCHTLAAQWYRAQGAATYDFLGGGDRYKLSLATHVDELHWLSLAPTWSPRAIAARVRQRFQSGLEA